MNDQITRAMTKGTSLLARIRKIAENEFNEGNLPRFLHYTSRYIRVHQIIYPGGYELTPGDFLNRVIEDQVFNSRN